MRMWSLHYWIKRSHSSCQYVDSEQERDGAKGAKRATEDRQGEASKCGTVDVNGGNRVRTLVT